MSGCSNAVLSGGNITGATNLTNAIYGSTTCPDGMVVTKPLHHLSDPPV